MKPFPPQAFAWRFMIEGYYDMGWRWVGDLDPSASLAPPPTRCAVSAAQTEKKQPFPNGLAASFIFVYLISKGALFLPISSKSPQSGFP